MNFLHESLSGIIFWWKLFDLILIYGITICFGITYSCWYHPKYNSQCNNMESTAKCGQCQNDHLTLQIFWPFVNILFKFSSFSSSFLFRNPNDVKYLHKKEKKNYFSFLIISKFFSSFSQNSVGKREIFQSLEGPFLNIKNHFNIFFSLLLYSIFLPCVSEILTWPCLMVRSENVSQGLNWLNLL